MTTPAPIMVMTDQHYKPMVDALIGVASLELMVIVGQAFIISEQRRSLARLQEQARLLEAQREEDSRLFRQVFQNMTLRSVDPAFARRVRERTGAAPTNGGRFRSVDTDIGGEEEST